MTALLQRFEDITKKDILTAGGKGANLGEMVHAGIPVPEGAVLTTEAYRLYVKENKIDLKAPAEEIRKAFLTGSMPEELHVTLLEYYIGIGERERVAVRSSATAEDLEDASFAGQQETYLNIRGEQELMEAVKRCYASLWGDRAVSYRREKGYEDENVALAVVIQKMVESEVAGVLFTVNPVSGRKEEMLINASYGLGESVVSGAVSPDELVCDRLGNVLNCQIGAKETQVIYGEKQTVTVPVVEEKRNRCSLSGGQIRKLTETASEIERHYHKPMDIEWAFADQKLYILQARAITTGTEERKEVDESKMPPLQPVNQKRKATLMFLMEKMPVPYFPLDYDFCMPISRQKAVIFAEGGMLVDNDCRLDDNGFLCLPTVKFKMNKNITHLPGLMKEMKDHQANVEKLEKCLSGAEPVIRKAAGSDTDCGEAAKELQQTAAELDQMRNLITETAYARFKYAVFPGFMMNRRLGKLLKKVDPALSPYNLLTGLSYKTAEMNRQLKELAEKLLAMEGVPEKILAGCSYEELTEGNKEAEQEIKAFLKENGYKSDFPDYCFTSRTWLEDKERFFQVLRPLLENPAGEGMSQEEGLSYYQELLTKMTAGLSDRKKTEVRQLCEYYRTYHVQRERTQYLWEGCFYACRSFLKRIASLLSISDEDLFYLRYEELQTVVKRGAVSDKEREIISRRKRYRPLVEAYWKRQMWEACKGDGESLKGVSGSAGTAEGRVCVITSPAEFYKLKKGDILVCHYTDPEWTPLFAIAGGVIADTGGVLSHAAIVAREYQIPAVLATGNATEVLKDGDRVLLDGTRGEIECL